MIHDFSVERIVAFITFSLATVLSSRGPLLSSLIFKNTIFFDSIIKGIINLIFALILFIITYYLKKWFRKHNI